MARRIEHAPVDETYPQVHRFAHLFQASLERPTPPTVVAEKILETITNGTTKLRHPVGADAEGFLAWRASLATSTGPTASRRIITGANHAPTHPERRSYAPAWLVFRLRRRAARRQDAGHACTPPLHNSH